jgi:hypothetical protein
MKTPTWFNPVTIGRAKGTGIKHGQTALMLPARMVSLPERLKHRPLANG